VKRISLILWLSLITTLTLPCEQVAAQQFPSVNGRQFPVNQMSPPGTAAQWAANSGRGNLEYFQPVRVSLPTRGLVTFYEGSPHRSYDVKAPAQASLVVGQMYRMRISAMPEFPGVEFFPSIELIDRLHPPTCQVEDFPIEFELTEEEFEWAANGRLVTKVVYLEQPERVPVTLLNEKQRITTIEPSQNAIAEADMLGRPVAIIRLGGRTPDPHQPDPNFFGPGGPIKVNQHVTQPESQSSTKSRLNNLENRTSSVTAQAGVISLRKGTARRVAQR
jgi:hypothetical protein